jgi:hypothetical protein
MCAATVPAFALNLRLFFIGSTIILFSSFFTEIPILLKVLSNQGIKANADMNIKAIAQKNNKSPMDIYETIKKASGYKNKSNI